MKIRERYPEMEIIIRSDSGFGCAAFYQLVDDFDLLYVTGIASNEVLKRKVSRSKNAVKKNVFRSGREAPTFYQFQVQS
ncbi:hypothetical protein JBKA6_0348 [Ichthyobacterium seriolicida]|uniref:Transposase DDE domain-containing protein n=2 Tax=Ichthyobacterium seriolicida TaxID=242600 RepID=A0A1J1DWY6_9FLAO|nr:hypothetical protein JBKA6_0348 [Ichthyobacterium seriolicida]